jgi:hypothetical protein
MMSSVRLSPELNAIRAGRIPRALALGTSLASLWTDAPTQRFLVRRSGAHPLAFTGMILLSHENGVENDGDRRHAVRLYETVNGVFIVEIALFAADDSVLAHSIAEEVISLADAEAFLSNYDPSAQARLALTVDDDIDAFTVATMAERVMSEAERLRADFDLARNAVFAAARRDDADTTSRRGH